MSENYADLASTTVGSSYTAGATTLILTSVTGFPSSFPYKLRVAADGSGGTAELFNVSAGTGTTLTVAGAQGTPTATTASNHAVGAVVTQVLTVSALLALPVGGDVTGPASTTVVGKIQGNTVTSGGLTKGNIFVASSTSNWAATDFSGDVTNSHATAGLLTVTQLQGQPFSASAVTKGQFVMGSAAGTYGPVSGSGDISWSTSTAGLATVTGLQGIAVPAPSGTNTVLQYNSSAFTWAVGAGVSYTIQPIYGTSNQSITITLNSLANGSSRASTVVDNSSTLAEDALIFLKLSSATSAVSATGYVSVYGYGTADGGTTYTEGATGTDAAITLTVPPNAVLLGVCNMVANTSTPKYGPFSFCKPYGLDRLPQKWGIIVMNQSGAALLSSANSVFYQVVNGKLV